MREINRILLVFILVVGLGLRLYGIKWGLPDEMHYYSYHPDETAIIASATNIDFSTFDLNPHFFNYGTLYIYLVAFGVNWASGLRVINPEATGAAQFALEFGKMHLLARLITVFLGIGTIYLVYLIGKNFYHRNVGLIAAGFLALLPLQVIHSHYATVDVPATFWIALTIFFISKITGSEKLKWYMLAGLCAGLGAATKYNSALVFLSLLIPGLFRNGAGKPKLKNLSLGLAFAILGFLLGCPYSALAFREFRAGLGFEMRHMREGHGFVFLGTGNGWWFHLRSSLFYAMGLPMVLVCTVGIIYALYRRQKADLILLAFIIPYYLLIGSWQVRFMRYIIPILPFLVLLGARILHYFFALRLSSFVFRLLIFAFLFGYLFLYSIAYDGLMAGKDTRTEAAEWVKKNVPKGTSIGLAELPWFYTAPISPYNGGKLTEREFWRWQKGAEYKIVITDWEAARLEETKPDYFILSEFEYADRLRLKEPRTMKFLKELDWKYRKVKAFRRQPQVLNLKLPRRTPPHDWLYPYPTVEIYKILTTESKERPQRTRGNVNQSDKAGES